MQLRFPIFFLAVAAFAGCRSTGPAEITFITETDPQSWKAGKALVIPVENNDTHSVRSLSILFRYDSSFEATTLPVSVQVTTPDSLRYSEDIILQLIPQVSLPSNKFGEITLPYRQNAILSAPGTYLFEIIPRQNMPDGIWAAGISIK